MEDWIKFKENMDRKGVYYKDLIEKLSEIREYLQDLRENITDTMQYEAMQICESLANMLMLAEERNFPNAQIQELILQIGRLEHSVNAFSCGLILFERFRRKIAVGYAILD